MTADLTEIAARFCSAQTITDITPLGQGLINDTYLVCGPGFRFVLQKFNATVFTDPPRIMENLLRISEHLRGASSQAIHLRIPAPLLTESGDNYHIDHGQQCWRALQWIAGESREQITGITEAEQVGFALAHFHRLFSDLDPGILHDTLPGFHITPDYLHRYHQVARKSELTNNTQEFAYCQQFIERFQNRADVLERAKRQKLLHERIIHGDPKLNNFLFAERSDTIVSLIDLDTVKPGLVHYDIGDCLRSCCHQKPDNRFDLDVCAAILKHYLLEAGHFFTSADYDYLTAAIELIPFELGLRFFTDYLQGNRYFKVDQAEQNLRRAVDQFQLCDDIHRQRQAIGRMIKQLCKG